MASEPSKELNMQSGYAPTEDENSMRDVPSVHDIALDFIKARASAADPALYTDPKYTRRLRRKVDLLVIPFLVLCYCMNFLDKVLLNYAAVMGLTKNLNLVGNQFSDATSAFWIAVVVATVPNVYFLQRFPTAKWLGGCLTVWGISTACHAAVQDYSGLIAVRVISGLCEAAVPASLMLLSSQYYTRSEQATRFSFWYAGMGLGQIFGGLFSFAFQHVKPTAPLAGWRIMFLVIGLFTICLGAAIFLLVPDNPMKAWFFTDEEKVNLLEHVRINQTGIETKTYQPRQLFEGLLDFQLWCMFAIVLLEGTGGGAITGYSATLLHSFGYSPMNSALLNMPSGVVNILASLFCGFMPRYFGNRWLWALIVTLIGVLGAALMSFAPHTNQAASLAGIYLSNFIIGAGPLTYQWITGNTAGHTKRAFVTAAITCAFGIGNIIGPLTFQAKDAPLYQPAKLSLVCTWSVSAVLILVLAVYYFFINRHRDTKYGTAAKADYDATNEVKAFSQRTDFENKEFRYNL